MNNQFVMTGTPKTATIGKLTLRKTFHTQNTQNLFYIKYLDVVTPGTADSSGSYYALHHDGSSWAIKEYGTKTNAFSLCQFIGKKFYF